MDISTLMAFSLYFLILLAIGYFSYHKQTSDTDFIVGNRSMNFWVISLSAHASDMSSWLFMALPSMILLRGIPQVWIAVGLLFGMFLNWQFVAMRLRQATERLDATTLSTFFERQFKDQSGLIRIITAVIIIFFLCNYLSANLIAMGVLFESLFGMNYYIGLTIATTVVMIYTFFGGFATVAWTDLFQALFLLVVILFVPAVAYFNLDGGMGTILAQAESRQISFKLIEDYSFESFLAIISSVGWGLGYFGQPHIVTKFLGIRDVSELRKSKYLGMSWMLLTLGGAVAVGTVGIAFFIKPLAEPQLVFVEMVQALFNPFLSGFILCAVIAATMSTMDSQVLVSASVLSEDLYKRFFSQRFSKASMVMITRIAVVIVSLISLGIAFTKNSTVMEVVQYAWAGLGSAFGPLMLTALYSKKATRGGAIAGILVGGIIAGTWQWVNPLLSEYSVQSIIPGFFLSLASIRLVSRFTKGE